VLKENGPRKKIFVQFKLAFLFQFNPFSSAKKIPDTTGFPELENQFEDDGQILSVIFMILQIIF
jgi:hypothetical protein